MNYNNLSLYDVAVCGLFLDDRAGEDSLGRYSALNYVYNNVFDLFTEQTIMDEYIDKIKVLFNEDGELKQKSKLIKLIE